jgi:hypothetical protein
MWVAGGVLDVPPSLVGLTARQRAELIPKSDEEMQKFREEALLYGAKPGTDYGIFFP